MFIRKHLNPLWLAVFAIVAMAAVGVSYAQDGPAGPKTSERKHLNMLVLGDSIMWGQGLKDPNKFWWRIKNWLQEKTGREVRQTVLAHSGASIEAPPQPERMPRPKDGEVNVLWPTVREQVEHGRNYYPDPAQVDLVMVNGCINDVGARHLLDSATSLDWLETSIKEKCGVRMQSLLREIVGEYKSAQVIVTSYYPIFSSLSPNNFFTRMLLKKLTTGSAKVSDRERRERLVSISRVWYQVSTRNLREAVEVVNAELRNSSSAERIFFAEVNLAPEHSFGAPDTLLWNFKFGSTNLSGLRKALVVLTFGTGAGNPNDQVREQRKKSCEKTYKRPWDKNENKAEKADREASYAFCQYAALGHPNQMGALIYAEAIKGRLHWLISKTGWLEKPPNSQSVSPN